MNITFALPKTEKCRVVYVKDGTKYQAIIPTPATNDGLQRIMLDRQVGMSQIQLVEPLAPRPEFHRPHPASRRISHFSNLDAS